MIEYEAEIPNCQETRHDVLWRYQRLGYVALFALALCVGCATHQPQPATEIEQERSQGAAAARVDWDCKDAGIYVFRQVASGERDLATGLPLRDGGTDAVPPARAAWVTGYNMAIQRHMATEGLPHTVQWTGQWPWNRHYGIRIATAVTGGEIVAAKVVAYAPDGSTEVVPQTASTANGSIVIVCDEYVGEAIALARYEISRSLIHRDGNSYASISGREVQVR